MHTITQVVGLLEDKFRMLVERYDFLLEENTVLRDNMTVLQRKLDEKEQLLSNNTDTLQTLRVAKTIQGSNNTKETTQKINTLIKEIDVCIAQLSD